MPPSLAPPSALTPRTAHKSCHPYLIMPETFESIPDRLIPWLLDQHVFWVATAPLSKDGHVNVSPKGMKGSFRVINANEVWYEDIMGSGRSPSIRLLSHER